MWYEQLKDYVDAGEVACPGNKVLFPINKPEATMPADWIPVLSNYTLNEWHCTYKQTIKPRYDKQMIVFVDGKNVHVLETFHYMEDDPRCRIAFPHRDGANFLFRDYSVAWYHRMEYDWYWFYGLKIIQWITNFENQSYQSHKLWAWAFSVDCPCSSSLHLAS